MKWAIVVEVQGHSTTMHVIENRARRRTTQHRNPEAPAALSIHLIRYHNMGIAELWKSSWKKYEKDSKPLYAGNINSYIRRSSN
jgi:hypothetical protein